MELIFIMLRARESPPVNGLTWQGCNVPVALRNDNRVFTFDYDYPLAAPHLESPTQIDAPSTSDNRRCTMLRHDFRPALCLFHVREQRCLEADRVGADQRLS